MAIVIQRTLHLDIKMHLDKDVLSVCHVWHTHASFIKLYLYLSFAYPYN